MEVGDRSGRHVPAAPVVAIRVEHGDGRRAVTVDGRALRVRRREDPYRAGLALAARRARELARPVRVRLENRWAAWPLVVHPDGTVVDARDGVAPSWAGPELGTVGARPPARPLGMSVAAIALATALLVGVVGTGVSTLSASAPSPPSPSGEPTPPPGEQPPYSGEAGEVGEVGEVGEEGEPGAAGAGPCRPVTLFALDGGPGGTVPAVADPLAQELGDGLATVSVPPPTAGTSYVARQQEALGAVASSVAELAEDCPETRLILIGHSEGAQVAGDLASRIGTDQEPRIPPDRVLAVGLFGDPARSPFTRVVPDEVAGQGALPPRAAGFGVLDSRTISICAPGDPVCDSPPDAAFPALDEALRADVHASYPELPVAESLTATQWATDSLRTLVASLPEAGAPGADPGQQEPGQQEPGQQEPGQQEPGQQEPGQQEPASEYPAADEPGAAPPTAQEVPPSSGEQVPPTAQEVPPPTGEQEAPRRSGEQVPPRSGEQEVPPSSGEQPPTDTRTPADRAEAIFALAGLEGFDLGQGGNVEDGEVPVAVASPNVPGHEAVQVELPAGGMRSEVRPTGAAQDLRAGQRLFFGWSAFLPDDFPVDAGDFQVVWQLHDGETGTSPPLALEIQQGRLWLANVGELVEDLGPVAAGENVSVQMEIEFEVGGGTVSLWRDGQQVLDRVSPPRGTMIDSFSYLKAGLYRRPDGSPPASLFLNDLKVGESFASVSDLAGAPTDAPVSVQLLRPWVLPIAR